MAREPRGPVADTCRVGLELGVIGCGKGLSDLDRLAVVGKSGMGALTYAPMEARSGQVADFDVGRGSRECGDAWLVKFRFRREPETVGRVEHAHAAMACAAGVNFPTTQVLVGASGVGYFAVRRFDRPSAGRLHVHTLSRMVGADHRMPSLERDHFLRATRIVTERDDRVEEAFRPMVLSVLALNRDDHSKDHAFAMDEQGNRLLIPAYGVTLSDGSAGEGKDPGRKEIAAVAGLA